MLYIISNISYSALNTADVIYNANTEPEHLGDVSGMIIGYKHLKSSRNVS